MTFQHRILIEGSFHLSGELGSAQQLADQLLSVFGEPESLHSVSWDDSSQLLDVVAAVLATGGLSAEWLKRWVESEGDQRGMMVEVKRGRQTTYRLQPWEGRVLLGDGIDFATLLPDSPTTPEAMSGEVYPGAIVRANERRVQIWEAVTRTRENQGLAAFAGYDAYKIEVDGVQVWILGRYCTPLED